MTKEIGDSTLLDTWAADGTIVEPSGEKKDNGWELGEQPPHEYANWVLNTLGKAVNHVLQNGVPAWNATTAYLTNNIVTRGGVVYMAKQNNTNSQPPNTNWQAIAPYTAHWSIEYLNGFLQLKGDSETPGNNKIYGTDGSGVRGWQPAPVQADGFKTGDIKIKYGSGEEAGFVRLNGRTIGNADSVATERANADTENLYLYLWDADTNLAVSGGRGASAAADYAANKRLTLPDAKNRTPVFLDGMGGSNTDRVTDAGDGNPGIDGKTLGATGGTDRHQLTVEQLAIHDHDQNFEQNHATGGNRTVARGTNGGFSGESVGISGVFESGGDEPHPNMQPSIIIGTVYIKL